MKDGLFVITSSTCPHCVTFKEKKSEEMKNITEIVIDKLNDDDKVWDIIDQLDVLGTPTVIRKDGDKYCELELDDLETEIKCTTVGKNSKPSSSPSTPQKEKPLSNATEFIMKEIGGSIFN